MFHMLTPSLVYMCISVFEIWEMKKIPIQSVEGVPDLSNESEFYHGLGSEQPPTTAMIRRELQQEILYQLSPPEV